MADVAVVAREAANILNALDALGVSAENATRLLNYHFEDFTFRCERGEHYRATVTGVSDNANFFKPFDVWKTPK
jgi:hypothetical protein